jgi:hypothetical protein
MKIASGIANATATAHVLAEALTPDQKKALQAPRCNNCSKLETDHPHPGCKKFVKWDVSMVGKKSKVSEAEEVDDPKTTIDPNHPFYKAGHQFGSKLAKRLHGTVMDPTYHIHTNAVAHSKDTPQRQSTLANKLHMQRHFEAGAHAAFDTEHTMTEAESAKPMASHEAVALLRRKGYKYSHSSSDGIVVDNSHPTVDTHHFTHPSGKQATVQSTNGGTLPSQSAKISHAKHIANQPVAEAVIDRSTPRTPPSVTGPQKCPICKKEVEGHHMWCKVDGKVAHDYCARKKYGK